MSFFVNWEFKGTFENHFYINGQKRVSVNVPRPVNILHKSYVGMLLILLKYSMIVI